MIEPGKKAPAFTGKDQDGNPVKLTDFRGRKLVLYFYPADDTTTCTEEACNLRDNYAALRKKGYAILGVSADDEQSHQKFIRKYSLPFPLLADVDRKVIEKYGVWGEKNMFGNKYMGILRTTYLIDENGKVAHVITRVRSKDHTAQILALWK